MRVGPVAIVNGTFGNRPHCIYRGFCVQGCKVNAKASPLVTHVPDAIEHGVEIRAASMAVRVETDETGHCTGVTYVHAGRERFLRAAAVAVAGYAIETPRLLLNSHSRRFPNGLANNDDHVGRYVMVQGAAQTAARFPEMMGMYEGPPPEFSSEQFYETTTGCGHPQPFIADGSVMPTQGSANPALTIMATASRLAQRLATKRAAPAGRPSDGPRRGS
jgi:choline dehydrogenase-like flavoprotein